MIRFCQLLEPTVGGINLEDIAAPDCFYIEETLRKTMKHSRLPRRPARHRDHLRRRAVNALEIVGQEDRPGARRVLRRRAQPRSPPPSHYERLGVRHENIIMCDRAGVIYEGRTRRHGPVQGALRERHAGAHDRRGAGRRRRVRRACRSAGAVTRRDDRARWRRTRSSSRSRTRSRRSCPTKCAPCGRTRSSPRDAATTRTRSTTSSASRSSSAARSTRARREVNEEMKMAATRALAALAQAKTCRRA